MEVEAEVTASVPGETEPLETSGSVCGSCHWLDGDGVWRKGSVPDAEQWDVVTGGKLETKKPAEDEACMDVNSVATVVCCRAYTLYLKPRNLKLPRKSMPGQSQSSLCQAHLFCMDSKPL